MRGLEFNRTFVSGFQALAGRIAVSCTLVRGVYNRAWNEVMLCDEAKVRVALVDFSSANG